MENFTPRVMDNWGLGYEALAEQRPDLVMLRMPAFGLDGPWRDRPGFAMTMEQLSGMCWVMGYQDGEPMLAMGLFDPIAGTHAAFAVVAALDHRRRTGEGQLIELPMIELATTIMAEQVIEFEAYGELMSRLGNRALTAAPQGVYACKGVESWIAPAGRERRGVGVTGEDARSRCLDDRRARVA